MLNLNSIGMPNHSRWPGKTHTDSTFKSKINDTSLTYFSPYKIYVHDPLIKKYDRFRNINNLSDDNNGKRNIKANI
jgi:hypothetical protein